MEKPTNKPQRQPLPPIAHWALVGVALGLAYIAISRAINNGSLLEYVIALVLFGLAIKHLLQAVKPEERS